MVRLYFNLGQKCEYGLCRCSISQKWVIIIWWATGRFRQAQVKANLQPATTFVYSFPTQWQLLLSADIFLTDLWFMVASKLLRKHIYSWKLGRQDPFCALDSFGLVHEFGSVFVDLVRLLLARLSSVSAPICLFVCAAHRLLNFGPENFINLP